MNRQALIATVLTSIVVTAYQLRQLDAPTAQATSRSAAVAPVVEAAPALQLTVPARSAISSPDLWNLKPLTSLTAGNLPSLKEMFKPYYAMSNGRFDSIGRSDRPQEHWEFQGVLVSGGTMRALFYNPALHRLKNLGKGDLVDDGLVVRSVGANSVALETQGEKKPSRFELRLFKGNKEPYVAKPQHASKFNNRVFSGTPVGMRGNGGSPSVLQGRVPGNAQPPGGRAAAPGRRF